MYNLWRSLRRSLTRASPHSWALWSHPRAAITYYLVVEAAAVAIIVVAALDVTVQPVDLLRAAALVAAALAHAEGSRGVERVRRYPDPVVHVDLNSVWTLPAALLLPYPLTAAVIVIIYTHMWLRVNKTPLVRRALSTASFLVTAYAVHLVVLASGGTSRIFAAFPGVESVGALAAAGIAYAAVNLALVVIVNIVRSVQLPVHVAVGPTVDNALEAATLCFGVFVAVAVAHQPLLVVFALPLVLVLHRNVLIRQLRDDARTDAKTGLRNAAAWNDHAQREVARAQRYHTTLHVLLIDIDWFKTVNDTYGHLAGDDVLRALADALHDEIRSTDAVGRFGGEEFVVLLPDTTLADMRSVAERLRERVSVMTVSSQGGDGPDGTAITGLTISIGAASYPEHGADVDTLVFAADAALYEAKNNGRNQTRVAS